MNRRSQSPHARVFALVASLIYGVLTGSARAQDETEAPAAENAPNSPPIELPKAAVLTAAGDKAAAGNLDSVLPAALEQLGVVNITARPGLDLNAIQIAIDCVDETVPCLRNVATQSDVQIVIAPAVQASNDEVVLTLLYFDARGEGEIRRVAQRQSGQELRAETLDQIPNMLRELFQLRAPNDPGEGAEPPLPQRGPSLVGPLVLIGAGVAIVGGGVVVGLIEKGTQHDYDKALVGTMDQRKTANDKASSGKTQALVTNVLFGVGAAAAVAGGIWLAIVLAGDHAEKPPQTALLPVIMPGHVGFALTHRGGSL